MAESLEDRRKRLIYRSLYTGMKETDLLLGQFARAHLPSFGAAELDQYEALLDTGEDPAIYAWANGQSPVPANFDNDVMDLLKKFKIGI